MSKQDSIAARTRARTTATPAAAPSPPVSAARKKQGRQERLTGTIIAAAVAPARLRCDYVDLPAVPPKARALLAQRQSKVPEEVAAGDDSTTPAIVERPLVAAAPPPTCSCKKCFRGMSPRMRFRISNTVDKIWIELYDHARTMLPLKKSSLTSVPFARHLPLDKLDATVVKANLPVTAERVGYQALQYVYGYNHVSAAHFIKHKGTPEMVLAAVIDIMESNPVMELTYAPEREWYSSLPVCDLDEDWEGLRRHWGVKD